MSEFNYSPDNLTLLSCDFSKLPKDIEIPYGCEEIADRVFFGADIQSVIIPDSVTKIGQDQFTSSENLKFVHLPSGLTHLSAGMFADCPNLERVEMPANVDAFPESLFSGCQNLKDIPFRNGIKELPADVFCGCTSVKSMIIPPSVKKICSGALRNCEGLTTLVLNSNIEEIEDGALSGCTSLKYIRIEDCGQDIFVDEDTGCLYEHVDSGALRLIKCPVILEEYFIPAEVIQIDQCAFDGCSNLFHIALQDDSSDNPIIPVIRQLLPEASIEGYTPAPVVQEERKPITLDDLKDIEVESDDDAEEESEDIEKSDSIQNAEEESPSEEDEIICSSQETVSAESDQPVIDTSSMDSATTQPETFDDDSDGFDIFDDDDEAPAVKQPEQIPEPAAQSHEPDDSQLASDSQSAQEPDESQDSLDPQQSEQETQNPAASSICLTDNFVSNSNYIESLAAKEITVDPADPDGKFLNILKRVAKHSIMLDEASAGSRGAYGELENLIVIAEKSANVTKEFSSHLIRYAQSLAERYGFKKVYLFEKLPIEDGEFSHAFAGFSHDKNIVYACMAKDTGEFSQDTKAFLEENYLPSEDAEIPSVIDSQPDTNILPLKLVVQDNYVEGLLFCAQKYLMDSNK